jgi:hypothetical protein
MKNFYQWIKEATEDEFMKYHNTGHISSQAYERYEAEDGLSWLGDIQKYPKLLSKKNYGPYTVEFRQTGNKLFYTKTDDNGEIVRGEDGLATTFSDEEIKQRGYPEHDQSIVAFINGKPRGLVSNEFGTIGVWIEGPFQKLGIGSDLLVTYMEMNPKFIKMKSKIGQMTNAGYSMSKSAYRKLVNKYGINFDKD